MSKFLKNSGHLTFLSLVILCESAFGQSSTCLYKKQSESRPIGVSAAVKSQDSVSYILRTGAFVNVVTWDCTRLGKRILIIIPASNDKTGYVDSVLTSIVGTKISAAFKGPLAGAAGKYGNTMLDVNIDGFGDGSIEISKDEYEARYVVVYSTSD